MDRSIYSSLLTFQFVFWRECGDFTFATDFADSTDPADQCRFADHRNFTNFSDRQHFHNRFDSASDFAAAVGDFSDYDHADRAGADRTDRPGAD